MRNQATAALTAVLVLTGCGDDSGSAGETSSSTGGPGTSSTSRAPTGSSESGDSGGSTTSSAGTDAATSDATTTSSGTTSTGADEGSSSSDGGREELEPPCPPGLIGEHCETQYFLGAAGVAVDGNDVYIAPFFANAILHHRRDSGLTTVLSATNNPADNGATVGDGHPLGRIGEVAVAPDGPIYVVDDDEESVVAIDRSTGERTLVSDDSDGNNGGAAVGTGPTLDSASSMAWDPVFERIIIGRNQGSNNDAIIAVDPETGDRTVVSDNSSGGFNISNPAALAVDPNDGTIYVADPNLSSVYSVDPMTGARAFVTGAAGGQNLGSGPNLSNARVIAVTMDGMLFVGDRGNATVLAVDLDNGDRTIVASEDVGDGDVLVDPFYMGGGDGEIFVTDSNRWSIIALDTTTNSRSTVFDSTLGEGQRLGNGPGPLATDGEQVFVGLRFSDALMQLDPVTGNRSILAGEGPAYDGITDVVFDPTGGSLYVVDDALDALLSVDVDTGNRTAASGDGVGSGPELDAPEGVALDTANDRAFVVDRSLDAVIEVDLTTGMRSVFSDDEDSFAGNAQVGSGPALSNGVAVVHDVDNLRLIVGDTGRNALVAISLAPGTEGDRTILSDASDETQGGVAVGEGPEIAPEYLWLDPAGTAVFVTSDSGESVGVFSVDLTTGDRTIVSSSALDFGTGWELSDPRGVVQINGDLFVADNGAFLSRIDAVGDRWVVSSGATETPL